MIYVLFLCTVFDGQPQLNNCAQLEVGQYVSLASCQEMIPVLIERNIRSGREMDYDNIHHRFKCAPPRAPTE